MQRLAAAHDAVRSNTHLEVYYHRYADNAHELPLMAEFAGSLGFHFASTLAYVTTVEKIIAIAQGEQTAEDVALLARLAVPLDRRDLGFGRAPRKVHIGRCGSGSSP